MEAQRSSVTTNNRGNVDQSGNLWSSVYHTTWHHTSLPRELQLSHGLVHHHLVFAIAQLKESGNVYLGCGSIFPCGNC